MTVEAIIALSGLVSSLISGLLGIGGGIALTPLLLYLPGLFGIGAIPVKIITGLTVAQAISASVLGAHRHRSYGNVSTRLVLLMGPPAAAASLAGAFFSRTASDQLLLGVFAAVSFVGGVLLVLPVTSQQVGTADLRVNAPFAIALALVIGGFGGMVGIGAIAFIVAVLVYFLRVPPRVAIGSSLGIGMFGAVAALIGSPLGAWVSVRTRGDALLRILAVVVALAALRIAWSAIRGA